MAKKSALGSLLPLFIIIVLLAVIGAVGFVIYSIANDVSEKTRQKLEKKNISFSKEGAKVGVKHKTTEQEQDEAQNMLVKIWNQSYFPAYKSRLGWMGDQKTAPATSPLPSSGAEKRKPFSRSSSNQNSISRTSSHPAVARTTSHTSVK